MGTYFLDETAAACLWGAMGAAANVDNAADAAANADAAAADAERMM